MANEFGELLRALRIAAAVSLGELSRHLEISVTYLSDVERGTRAPLSPARIGKTANFLGLTAADATRLLEVAAKSRGFFELAAENMSPTGSKVGAALMRGWPQYTEADLERIAKLLEELEDQ